MRDLANTDHDFHLSCSGYPPSGPALRSKTSMMAAASRSPIIGSARRKASSRKSTKQSTGLRRKRALPGEEIGKSGRHIKQCCRMKQAAFKTEQYAKLRPANASGVLEHRPKDRLQIAGRARDDLQHLGGRALLLQCLGKLSLARCEPFF